MSERENQRGTPESGECHICGEVFPTQEELSEHLLTAHETKGLDPA